MGFLKGKVTFTRYRVVGDMPPDFRNFFDDRIKLNAFREMTTEPEEKCLGWTSIDNVLDTNFEYANYQYGEYRLFSLRVDRKTIPPALLRIKTLEAEKRFLEEKGLKKLFREQRAELKETIRGELLKKTPAVPSFYEVCWAPSEGWLLFGSLTEKVAEDFEEFFKQTFTMNLVPYVPWDPVFLDSTVVGTLGNLKKDSGPRR